MILWILLSALLFPQGSLPDSRDAVRLYDKGLYEEARKRFETLGDNAENDGYEVLCALNMRTPDAGSLVRSYERKYSRTRHSSAIFNLYGINLFDEQEYDEALLYLRKVRRDDLRKKDLAAWLFRLGYCEFALGSYPEAASFLVQMEELPVSIYLAPARYVRAFISYADQRFDEACELFELSGEDPRFKDVSDFYVTECKFLTKDYEYVVEHAEALMENSPKSRQAHLARILSESYLVLDNKQLAKEFYELSYTENLSRSDWFYSGSVLYGVEDYRGAVENFSKMEDRSDSLGQIANYQMANAYLHLRDKVDALDAFKQASSVTFDPEIQEDAFINYAKLAFDINQDNSGFEEYIRKYSTTRRGELIYSYMALTALNRKDYAAAVEAYDRIDELDEDMESNYMKANFLRGVQLFNSGAYRDAIPCLRAAAYYLPRRNRLNQTIRLWLAEAYYKTENYAEAAKIYEDLYNISAFPGMQEADILMYDLAYCNFNQGNFETASRWFDKYISSGDTFGDVDAVLRRADCDFELKNYKEAVVSYGKAVASGSADLYSNLRQALSYGLSGNRKAKIDVLSKAAEADPSTPLFDEVLYELGRTYMDAKNTKGALAAFHKLRDVSQDREYVAKALTGLGLLNRNQNNLEAALDYYKEVVSLMRGSEYSRDALLAIESIYQAKKQPEKYLEYVESNSVLTSSDESDRENLYFNTGEQLFLAGNFQQAAASLQSFLEKYPESSRSGDACFYIAESYRETGAKEKACDLYRKVWNSNASDSFREASILKFASLSYELEHFKDAYDGYVMLRDSARLEQNRKTALTGIMRSAYRGRNFQDAVASAGAIIEKSEDDPSLEREAGYIRAKSLLALSRRDEALSAFRILSKSPSTPEGAEATFILIRDMYDRGDFESVEKAVYNFSSGYGDESYWLAKAFLLLGDSFVERGQLQQAEVTFQSIKDGYEPYGPEDDVPELVEGCLARVEKLKNN